MHRLCLLIVMILFGCVVHAADMVALCRPHVGGEVQYEQLTADTYRFKAVPNPGYSFLQWTDGNTDLVRTYTHPGTMGLDVTFHAVFTRDEDLIADYGHVDVQVADPATLKFLLTAQTDMGNASFYKWNNGISENPLFYREADGTRSAYFITIGPQMTVSVDNHIGGLCIYQQTGPTSYQLEAAASDGYSFLTWLDGYTNESRIFTMPDGVHEHTLRAGFVCDSDLVQQGGSVKVDVLDPEKPSYLLTAQPTQTSMCAFTFGGWNYGGKTSTLPYKESDGIRTPVFYRPLDMAYDIYNSRGGKIHVTPLTCGYTIEAIPNSPYEFYQWTDGETARIRDIDYLPETYKAIFCQLSFRVKDQLYYDFHQAELAAGTTWPVELVGDAERVDISENVRIEGNNHTIDSLFIGYGAILNLTAPLNTKRTFIQSTSGSSGQLIGTPYLSYYDLFLDVLLENSTDYNDVDKWYGLSVPFEVDVTQGVSRASGQGTHISGYDYLLWEYDGVLRARTGNGWKQLLSGTMKSGKFYMMGILGTEHTWRFKKKNGAAYPGSLSLALTPYPSNIIDHGWNALGNSQVQYVSGSIPGIPFVQVYDNIHTRYLPKMLSTTSFVVGCPFFTQIETAGTMMLTHSTQTNPAHLYAPSRATEDATILELRLSNNETYDALLLTLDNEPATKYTIGKDMTKLSFSQDIPQLWTSAYGSVLAAQHISLTNGYAQVPISLFAPTAGTYTLELSESSTCVHLYSGHTFVADLTSGGCLLSLTRGVNTNYSLHVGNRLGEATGMNDASVTNSLHKMIINQRLYIQLPNGTLLNALGQETRY